MIVDKPESHFIFVLPWDHLYRHYNYINYQGQELTNKDYLEFWGKWIILGSREKLDQLASKLDSLVEARLVPAAKYDREPIQEFRFGECVMCVYCDSRNKEEVWARLAELGVQDKAWVFERETVQRWMPGGHLLESWIRGQGLDPEAAQRVRLQSQERFAKMFEHDYAIFRGVFQ